MRITTLTLIGLLLIGTAACNNPAPTEPAATTPATVEAPANNVMPTPEPSNTVADPNATNGVGPVDEPRGNPDRRDTDAGPDRPPNSEAGAETEPK